MNYQNLLMGAGLLFFGAILGFLFRRLFGLRRIGSLEEKSKRIILEAQEKAVALLDDAKREERERKAQLDKLENRIREKETSVERELRELRSREERLKQEGGELERKKVSLQELETKAREALEKTAELTTAEAKERIINEARDLHREELHKALFSLERERRAEIEKKSLGIITTAIQRYARSHVAEITTSVFNLQNEDLKGKIIGREGRNIRALERATGVEIIMDEAPDAIVISSFDPLRREIARLSLDKLIRDGRIQPAKIEEKVEEAKRELDKRMIEIGEQASLELGIIDLPKEILQLLGRLYFRTSYGQNVLVHSIEMGHIAGMLAAELGANVDVAKRGALLHDIGKAISHEVEGTHVELGRKILKKYGIAEAVIRAMESHHEEYPFSTPESFIVTAADALSAARPGARRDNVENYLKRLEDLEKLAGSFNGVKQAYALSAGREVRVFVVPEKIDDFGALELAKSIAAKIQSELKYPGEIKVNVIRETRAVEYAK